ncbi:hypothetical protein ASG58_22150 [Rhizobium sp. Leaf383]|nr:hypothetical protein ASG58_22150 [Rhizobium sp. Leaf383]
MSIEAIVAEKYADLPSYAIEDALVFLVKRCRDMADSFDRMVREERELADRMEEALQAHRRPRLRLVGGAS